VLRTRGAQSENVHDAVKSSFLPGFLESLPEIAAERNSGVLECRSVGVLGWPAT